MLNTVFICALWEGQSDSAALDFFSASHILLNKQEESLSQVLLI